MTDDVKSAFAAYLHSENLKMTPQRELILDIFLSNSNHISSEELYNIVNTKDNSIGQATVYRMMKLLSDSAIARECEFGDGRLYYELNFGKGHHDHLVCVKCGRKIEVYDEIIEKQQDLLAKKHGFKLISHRLDFFGICGDCAMSEKTTRPQEEVNSNSGAVETVYETLPLSKLESGGRAVVMEFILDGKHGLSGAISNRKLLTSHRSRIQELGIRAGKMVEMLNNKGRGPVMFKVDDSRIALGRGLAMKIIVRKEG
ncbi:transcriptional repressor [Candidatus Magnetominusculus dajiuhuensis]|uniref:transcriptional repressor n=1 Tax=Candidatus Magnetominusculus dajiuhuensis TaxID=3137712 RepID=UPI003B43462C